jgi:hypothetical protein
MQGILFLDIDGVLNGHLKLASGYCGIEPHCVEQLNRITDATGAGIVLTSAWRYMMLGGAMSLRGFRYLLKTHGITGTLVDHTVADEEVEGRNKQIEMWLRRHNSINGECRFAILEDLVMEWGWLADHVIQTNGQAGLTEADADLVIDLLVRAPRTCNAYEE